MHGIDFVLSKQTLTARSLHIREEPCFVVIAQSGCGQVKAFGDFADFKEHGVVLSFQGSEEWLKFALSLVEGDVNKKSGEALTNLTTIATSSTLL